MDRPARPALTVAATAAPTPVHGTRLPRLRHALPALVSLAVFLAALAVLRIELRTVSWRQLTGMVLATPWPRLLAALALTAVNYTVLTGYDLLAFAWIGSTLPRRRIAGAAFVAYAISHTVGFAAVSGASVRYRFYSRWGVSAEDMGASLLKGFDVEEAALLLGVLLVLRLARPAFDRRAAFFEARFSPAWIAALVGGLAASVWLGLFAFQHVNYAAESFWRFEIGSEASRFLRGSVGAAIVVLLAGLARLLGHPPHEIAPPDDAALADAARIVAGSPSTTANLVFLRDKGLIFDEDDGAGAGRGGGTRSGLTTAPQSKAMSTRGIVSSPLGLTATSVTTAV